MNRWEAMQVLTERTIRPMMKAASFLFAGALMASAAPQTFTGVITDTMCGNDHAMMKVSPDSKCVVECVKGDKNTKYALFDGKKVTVTGTLYEKTKILQVDSIAVAGNSPAPAHQH